MNPYAHTYYIVGESPTVAPIVFLDGKAKRRERRAKQRKCNNS